MASPSQEEFTKASASAVEEAAASREELGRARAAAFLANPDDFDPRGLLSLGTPGLRTFARAIGITDLGLQPIPESAEATLGQPSPASGWVSQQRRIISFETIAAAAGIFAGVVAIAAISLVTWLNH